jgi:RNA polymerase sigma-70 factor (ECF subfamily)
MGARREGHATAAALEVADPGAGPEQVAVAREQLAAVWAVADDLAPQQRTIFLLRFAQEMSLAEIADALELEVGTVKAHLFRAVGTVRMKLAAETQRAQRKKGK